MMSTPTVARPPSRKDSHWYTRKGEPLHEVMGKTTGKPRPTTIADARELDLVPSVTTILKVIQKEGLVRWMIEQAVLATVTTPKKPEEALDSYIERVLHVEKVQEEEAQLARDKGIDIHDALAALFEGQQPDPEIAPWVMPAFEAIQGRGPVHSTETVLVGDGYAGRTDLILGGAGNWEIWDFKSTKKLPDPKKGGAWPEHRLQLAAYAHAFISDPQIAGPIKTANLYISSVDQGKFVVCEHEDWSPAWGRGFLPLLEYWRWVNNFGVVGTKTPDAVLRPAPADHAATTPPPQPGRKIRVDVGVRTQIVVPGPVPQPLPPPMPVKQ